MRERMKLTDTMITEVEKDNAWYATQVFSLTSEGELALKVVAGVYFLMDGDEVVYVGKSGHIFSRVMTHLADEEGWDRGKAKIFESFRYLLVGTSIRDEVEQRCIAHFRPRFNSKNSVKSCIRKYGGQP